MDAQRDEYLDACGDFETLAYELAQAHVECCLDTAESEAELTTDYIVRGSPGSDQMFVPIDCFGRIERLLAARAVDDRFIDSTLAERHTIIGLFVEETLLPKVRELVPIVLHHQAGILHNVLRLMAEERRAEERAAAAAKAEAEAAAEEAAAAASEACDSTACEAAPAAG